MKYQFGPRLWQRFCTLWVAPFSLGALITNHSVSLAATIFPIQGKFQPATIADQDGFTNLRSGPGKQFPVVGRVNTGDVIEVTPSRSQWWLVHLKTGETGYIHSSRIRLGTQPVETKRVYTKQELLKAATQEPAWISRQHGFNYVEVVKKALAGDEKSLQQILNATSWMDGAAAELHGTVVSGLLHILGDEKFSLSLKRIAKARRMEVWAALGFELDEVAQYLGAYFPETARLVRPVHSD